MAVTGKKVLRLTADADLYNSGLNNLEIAGIRLVSAAADCTAKLYDGNSNAGPLLYSMAALAKTSDDTAIPTRGESGSLFLALTGTGAEVFVYLT